MGTYRTGTLARGVPRHSLTSLRFPVKRAVPAVVVTRSSSRVDVPLDSGFNDTATLGREKWFSAVFIRHINPSVLDVISDNLGRLRRNQHVSVAPFLVLEWSSGSRPVAEFQRGPSFIEVPEVKCPKAAHPHPGLPENQERNVPVGSVLVLPEEVQQVKGLIPSEKVVADLVVLVGLGNSNHIGHAARDGRDVFAEFDELLDCHHILPGSDDLNLGQPVFLVPLYEFAVEVV